MSITSSPALLVAVCLAAVVQAPQALAQSSEASVVSTLVVGELSATPVTLLAAGAALTVSAVDASAAGSTWVLERAADGARGSVRFAGHASVALGTAVVVTSTATGQVLSAAGRAIAFVPNEFGASLLHHQRVAR